MNLALLAVAVVSLNGLWDFRFEKDRSLEDVGLPAFEPTDKMIVPGSWDAMSRWYDQRGTGCYRRHFELDHDVADALLVVDGSGVRSKYWIDGREVGASQLLFSRLEFATGPLKAGRHEVVAAVDSVVDNKKVKIFWNYYDLYAHGGFHHGVWLETLDAPDEVRKVVVRTRDYKTGRVELEALYAMDGPADFTASVSFDGKPAREVAFRNRRATLNVPDFKLWSPSSPNLHTVTLSTSRHRSLSVRFGIRQVGTAKKRITLNGRPIYLKGVNRHEMHPEFGCSTPKQLMYEDVMNLKDLGGNFIRGSHYPQCDDFLSLCDELGVLVWEESLGWNNTAEQTKDPEFRRLLMEQTRTMVRHSINHPCIVISGFLNEYQSDREECRKFVDSLIDAIRAEDSGHLVTFGCNRVKSDISNAKTDIIAYNAYPCFYTRLMKHMTSEEMRRNTRGCHEELVRCFRNRYKDDRPIIISETGVKADFGVHDPRGRSLYSEDFQAEYERIMLEEIFANQEIGGVAIWQFVDSKSMTRVEPMLVHRVHGHNTGGLYDVYRRPKMAVEEVRKMFRSKAEYPDGK